MTSHSGEIIHDDIYVSDGSEDESDIEVVLVSSRNGIMRRGGMGGMAAAKLIQPNRQWIRGGNAGGGEGGSSTDPEGATVDASLQDDSNNHHNSNAMDLTNLDPAQRAARLLQEKQRKLELEKILARQRESEENAGRDPTLFSKRTAFDIRFDQIEDKPWMRGSGDIADFFNYDLQEEDWLEYSQQQLQIRQELIDAARQKRSIDQSIVPVTPRIPALQTPRVAVAPVANSAADSTNREDENVAAASADDLVAGPDKPTPLQVNVDNASSGNLESTMNQYKDLKVIGGAWGVLPGSNLEKLLEGGDDGSVSQNRSTNIGDGVGQESAPPRSAHSQHGSRDVSAAAPRGRGNNTMEGGFRSHPDDPPSWNVHDDRRHDFHARPPNDRGVEAYHLPPGAAYQRPVPPEQQWYDGGWQQAPQAYPPQAEFRGGYRGSGGSGGGRTAPFLRGGQGGDSPESRRKRLREGDTWRR